MCNCKKYKPNNLDNRIVLNEIKQAYTSIQGKSIEDITDADWLYLYDVYRKAYPRSNGQPNQGELIEVLKKASQLQTAYK
jgi:hypothetical protein